MKYKRIAIFCSIFLLGLFQFSCDKIKEAGSTSIRITLSEDFRLKADTSSNDSLNQAEILVEQEIDAIQNRDFALNRSKLLEVEFDKLEYLVKELSAGSADSLIYSSFEFFSPADGRYEVLASENNRKLTPQLNSALNIRPEAAAKFIGLIKNAASGGDKIKILFRGKMNKRPVDFIIAPSIFLNLKTKL